MKCRCGKVKIKPTESEIIITCTECGWHYTYKALPPRLADLMRSLIELLDVVRIRLEGNREDV